MEKFGYVRQFKVCCNHEAHLRGNVYVEFRSSREAIKCFRSLQGRWYGGKQLQVEFCGIQSWTSAICGLFFKRRCPKGNSCNFLHVFKNPLNMFHKADRDEHRTPPYIEKLAYNVTKPLNLMLLNFQRNYTRHAKLEMVRVTR